MLGTKERRQSCFVDFGVLRSGQCHTGSVGFLFHQETHLVSYIKKKSYLTVLLVSFTNKWDSVLLCSPLVPSFPNSLWPPEDRPPAPPWPQWWSVQLTTPSAVPSTLQVWWDRRSFTATAQTACWAGCGWDVLRPWLWLDSSWVFSSSLSSAPRLPENLAPSTQHRHSACVRQAWPRCPL